MKLSDKLKSQIIAQYTATKHFDPEIAIPKLPTEQELLKEILATPPYTHTAKEKWAHMEQTNEIYCTTRKNYIKLPQEIPIMRRGTLSIWDNQLKIEDMTLSPTYGSCYDRYYNKQNKMEHGFRYHTLDKWQQFSTLQQLLAHNPELEKLECVINALTHEKAIRGASKERRKNEVLTPVVVEDKATIAIAKARLLGAKFLS